MEGYFQDLYEFPYLDLTQPWRYPQTVEEMTFMGKMYMGCNTITHLAMSSVETVFFDMALYDRFDLQESFGDLYQIAKDGKWTLDYMKMVSKDVYGDVNGDGIADDGDTMCAFRADLKLTVNLWNETTRFPTDGMQSLRHLLRSYVAVSAEADRRRKDSI